jgi:universal stress protein A
MPAAGLFRRVLVPHDFSRPADRAVALAARLAAPRGGKLVVLHAIPPFYPPPEMTAWLPDRAWVADSRKRLERAVRRATRGTRTPATCRVVLDDPVRAILGAARSADVIVMATAGRSGLEHLWMGSVAEKVVRHAPVPVLTVRARRRGR